MDETFERSKLKYAVWSMKYADLVSEVSCCVWCSVGSSSVGLARWILRAAEARKSINIMKVLEKAMVSCTDSDQLQHRIQLPCIRIHKASWDKKSLQQKLSSVCAALGVLLQGLRSVRDHSHLPCQTSILRSLDHNMQNHRHILSNLDHTKTSTCSQSTPEQQDTGCTNLWSKSLRQTLQLYARLLSGPLELLLVEFSPNCTQHPSGST